MNVRELVARSVLVLLLFAGVAVANAQGRLGPDLLDVGRGEDRGLRDEGGAPGGDAGPAIGAFGQRLDLGPVDVGFSIAPRRLMLDTPADSASSAVRYRLGETDLPRGDVGVDLRLRWPSWAGAPPLEPYVSFGPSLSRALTDESSPVTRPQTARSDPGLPVGMRGSVGLTWHLAPDASLYGEYRMTQDRPFAGRHGGDVGSDLFYGFSIRF